MSPIARRSSRAASQRGFSLIELMVGITIALVVMLVIFNVLTVYEGRKRTATSVNDINQAGAFGVYMLDKAVRSGGSGFTSVWSQAYGCRLNVQHSNPATTILPAAAFPAPFDNVPGALQLAPVLIGRNLSSVAGAGDVLIVMAGTSGFGETPPRMRPSTALYALPGVTRNVQMRNTLGFRHGDLVLIGNPSSPCLLSQVHDPAPSAGNSTQPAQGIGATITSAPSFTTSDQLPLGPTNAPSFFADAGADVAMSALVTGDAFVAPIGNINAPAGGAPANPPQFRMYAVGANQTLWSYDPLRIDAALAGTLGTPPQATPIIDGVTELHAIYGVDTNNDGVQDAWVEPTGVWAADATGLLAGTVAAQQRMRQIVSVRVAMVMRTSLPERPLQTTPSVVQVTGATLPQTIFDGTPFSTSIAIPAGTARDYRYRVVESTIPVRNNLMPQQ